MLHDTILTRLPAVKHVVEGVTGDTPPKSRANSDLCHYVDRDNQALHGSGRAMWNNPLDTGSRGNVRSPPTTEETQLITRGGGNGPWKPGNQCNAPGANSVGQQVRKMSTNAHPPFTSTEGRFCVTEMHAHDSTSSSIVYLAAADRLSVTVWPTAAKRWHRRSPVRQKRVTTTMRPISPHSDTRVSSRLGALPRTLRDP